MYGSRVVSLSKREDMHTLHSQSTLCFGCLLGTSVVLLDEDQLGKTGSELAAFFCSSSQVEAPLSRPLLPTHRELASTFLSLLFLQKHCAFKTHQTSNLPLV